MLFRSHEIGAAATLIDLRDYQLIFCDGKENESGYPNDVFRLRDEVKSAHGAILGTPEYHGGVSGVLKNALDLMGFEELEGKMLGLVGVSGGALGAVHASATCEPSAVRFTPGLFPTRSPFLKLGKYSMRKEI